MSKEKYYNKIKRFIYQRFNELELIERNNGEYLYLRYKNEEYAQIKINKKSGRVLYYFRFRNKICKTISLEKTDFEILLSKWVEDTFQIKMISTAVRTLKQSMLVENTNQIKLK